MNEPQMHKNERYLPESKILLSMRSKITNVIMFKEKAVDFCQVSNNFKIISKRRSWDKK